MFSMVRSCERNIKRYRNSKMRQRWLAAVLLHCEQRFKRVQGYASIDVVVAAINANHLVTKVARHQLVKKTARPFPPFGTT